MVTSFLLFAVETVPLLIYIFVGLVVISVPVFAVWEKVVQPKLDAKKKSAKKMDVSAEAAESAFEGGEDAIGEGEPAEGEEELAMPADGEEQLAMPAEDDFAEGDLPEPEDVAFEEALPDDAFTVDTGEKPKG